MSTPKPHPLNGKPFVFTQVDVTLSGQQWFVVLDAINKARIEARHTSAEEGQSEEMQKVFKQIEENYTALLARILDELKASGVPTAPGSPAFDQYR